ncbi:MAG: hypothetical protein ACREDF_11705 [Thermoplasmata archaeon]
MEVKDFIDDLDVGILLYVLENHGATATGITRALYADAKPYEYHKSEVRVRHRTQRLAHLGFLHGRADESMGGARRTSYSVEPTKVFLGEGNLEVRGKTGKTASMSLGEFLVVANGGDVHMRSITEIEHRYAHEA